MHICSKFYWLEFLFYKKNSLRPLFFVVVRYNFRRANRICRKGCYVASRIHIFMLLYIDLVEKQQQQQQKHNKTHSYQTYDFVKVQIKNENYSFFVFFLEREHLVYRIISTKKEGWSSNVPRVHFFFLISFWFGAWTSEALSARTRETHRSSKWTTGTCRGFSCYFEFDRVLQF